MIFQVHLSAQRVEKGNVNPASCKCSNLAHNASSPFRKHPKNRPTGIDTFTVPFSSIFSRFCVPGSSCTAVLVVTTVLEQVLDVAGERVHRLVPVRARGLLERRVHHRFTPRGGDHKTEALPAFHERFFSSFLLDIDNINQGVYNNR